MYSTEYTSKSKNLFRERSIPTFRSRQLSVANIFTQKRKMNLRNDGNDEHEKTSLFEKQDQINKLRKNLETAVSAVLVQKLQNSKSKQQIGSYFHHRVFLQNKIKIMEKQYQILKNENHKLNMKCSQMTEQNKRLENKCKQNQYLTQMLKLKQQNQAQFSKQKQQLQSQIQQIPYLKNRISALQLNNRNEKLSKKQIEKTCKILQLDKQKLKQEILKVKPKQQQLKQRILYFERVNLDLQRKMQDFNRRQNDYIKQITTIKMSLSKMTMDRDKFKNLYEQTFEVLNQKSQAYDEACLTIGNRDATIDTLNLKIQDFIASIKQIQEQLKNKSVFFKKQGEENDFLVKRNRILQEQQYELRRITQASSKIAQEVNVTIVRRTEEIRKLNKMIDAYKKQLNACEERYNKFDKLFEEGSERANNEIRDGYYVVVRINNDLNLQIKQLKLQFEERSMIYGEQRDAMSRNIEIRKMAPPNDQNQYESIFYEKTESILLLQKSNDQLLKIKKDHEDMIESLNKQMQDEKKEAYILKLKAADLFKAKKQIEQSRKTMQRYQEMIAQQKQNISDLQSQLAALRERNTQIMDKNFKLELNNQNLQVSLKAQEEVMKQLDIATLQVKKVQNQKNAHMIQDSLQRLENGIKSLSFFFNCSFCNELPTSAITLAICGHNYCTKCKQAYAQSCFECDNGLPIEKVFQNKFLKQAGGKYKFLLMVAQQLKGNFNNGK